MFLVVLVAVLIIAATAFLSLLEASMFAVDELRLVTLLYNSPDNKQAINKVFKKKREHLSAIVLLSTLISISGSTFLGAMAARKLDDFWLAIFTVLLAYFMLVFAKVLPKLLAVQIAGQVVGRWAPLIHVIYTITRPVLLLAMIWTRLLPKPMAQAHSSDELRSIIRHYGKHGVIGKKQRKYAEAVLTSGRKRLSQLVEHSQSVICLSANETVASASATLRASPCKRYVVLQDNKPIGVVLYRHLARCLVNSEEHKSIAQLMRRTIILAPETTLNQAMKAVQKARAAFILLPGETVEQTRIISAKMLYQALLH